MAQTLSREPARGERPQRFVLLVCGLLMLGCGLAAIGVEVVDPRAVIGTTGYLILAAGVIEIVAGIAQRRIEQIEGRLDIILGLISLGVGGYLIANMDGTAARLAGLLTLWLLLRGGLDLVAAFLTTDLFTEEGRILRASVDLVLGLISYIGLGTTAWWERFLGWPSTAATASFLFAGISLAAAGLFLTGISRPRCANTLSDVEVGR
ncbi:DUF308 domain-containing protein [Allosphingosinicella vermicomposti]|uniref:DUF308 domain-containing protein n=1 Tax=Allosphingosinicella vermicomposti TaxID=614671 RepID=UPI00131A4EB4|nr:DUF308 domain-containing protein [Allosphingosinicella vermicomposti]